MKNHLLDTGWIKILKEEFQKDYFLELERFLKNEYQSKDVFPPKSLLFNAFNQTPYDKVKVIIIGQDPYHGEGQAHGLSFSVQKSVKTPPSLKNIYKELKTDLNLEPVSHGNLQSWANEGVLLLNNVLSVEKSNPGSHRKKGWEQFTDFVISVLNQDKENLVFILWGNDAKKKAQIVDREKHLVLESAHPSPFSFKKFLGCKHFSKTNEYLISHKIKPINWQLPL